MALNWDIGKIKNYVHRCFVRVREGEPMFEEMQVKGSKWYHPEEDGEKDLTVKQRLNPITDALIWRSLLVGLNKITEKNLDEWMYRIYCNEIVFQDPFKAYDFHETEGWVERPFCKQDLIDHIGLSTNVSNTTRKQFWKKLMPDGGMCRGLDMRWKEEIEEEA
jgi:hypothetical protein